MLLLLLLCLCKLPDLGCKSLKLSLCISNSLFHLPDERLGRLGHREESDVIFIGHDILLKLMILLDQTLLLRELTTATTLTLWTAKFLLM